MMFQPRRCCRVLAPLLGVLLLPGAVPAGETVFTPPTTPVHVFHSPGDDGVDPRPAVQPGCGAGPGPDFGLITNGGFETGDFTGWQVDSVADLQGDVFVESGTTLPVSALGTVGPAAGAFYAVTDMDAPGTYALSQPFTVPAGASQVQVSFQLFENNLALETYNTGLLDHTGDFTQFARVDILNADAFFADPFTTRAGDVVATLYQSPAEPVPPPLPYGGFVFDITSEVAGGGNFVLRFAQSNNVFFLHLGVDEVSIGVAGGDGEGTPTDGDPTCVIQGGPGEVLHLWLDGGSNPGGAGEVVCQLGQDGGTGDNVCGADILLETTQGPAVFTHFRDVIPGTVHFPACTAPPDESGFCPLPAGTQQLRLNFLRGGTQAPGVGPRKFGDLVVDSTGAGASNPTAIAVSGIGAAGGSIQFRPIPEAGLEEIAVPEPGLAPLLAAGLLSLGWLARRRRTGG